jgi:hypothetical protein
MKGFKKKKLTGNLAVLILFPPGQFQRCKSKGKAIPLQALRVPGG